jgi:hypothetical protein
LHSHSDFKKSRAHEKYLHGHLPWEQDSWLKTMSFIKPVLVACTAFYFSSLKSGENSNGKAKNIFQARFDCVAETHHPAIKISRALRQ